MAIYAKNTDTVEHKWAGQKIQPSAYYSLESLEEARWANNSQVLTDIGNGTLVIARDDSGNTDITDVAEAINYLKGEGPKDEDGFPLISPTYENNQGLQAVWSSQLYTATAGVLNIYDELIVTEQKTRGGWYEIMCDPASPSPIIGDYIEFSIVDKDDTLGLFATYGLVVGVDVLELGKFVKTEFINPWGANRRQEFLSRGAFDVIPGLYFRTYYNSTGADDVKFKRELYSHEA